MISSENNIIVPEKISLPFPFSMNRALPIDARSFFTSFEEAAEAVRYAVELERDENGNFILPPEYPENTNENGGVDSEYYYGQFVVVTSNNGQSVDVYVVVKKYDENENAYGALEIANREFLSQYLTESEIRALVVEIVSAYIDSELDVDCITDYIFANETDGCGNDIPSNGLYAYGLKESDGKIGLCEEAKKVLSFDPATPYDKNTNPLATVNTVKNNLEDKVDKIEGYGLSQNDFTDCMAQKLQDLPNIRLEGDRLIINGRSFRLTEWYEIFDYYVGWLDLNGRSVFSELTTEELLNAVDDTGTVPSEGKLYGPSVACGRNTFFVMIRKHLNIDGSYHGEISQLSSNGIVSPIHSNSNSLIPHSDVTINDLVYEVFGLHTPYPNSSDTIQIAFNTITYDFYVLFGKVSYHDNTYYVNIDGDEVEYSNLTIEQLLSMSVLENGRKDTFGYTVKPISEKEIMVLHDNTEINCDYIINSGNIPEHTNTMFVMYRDSGTNKPLLDKVVWNSSLDNGYYFDRETHTDFSNNDLQKTDVDSGIVTYRVKAWYRPTVDSFDNDFGITFTN